MWTSDTKLNRNPLSDLLGADGHDPAVMRSKNEENPQMSGYDLDGQISIHEGSSDFSLFHVQDLWQEVKLTDCEGDHSPPSGVLI